MPFLAWMYDLAREQSPHEDSLREMLLRSRDAGYDAVGLYLEHRFQYSSAPWAAADGALSADVARRLSAEFRPQGLRVIPFINTLGHMEGFIRAQGGEWLSEGPSEWNGGIQICASREECARFAEGLITDVIAAFDDEWIHLGGDETRQLGQCPQCAARVEAVGKGGLYASYFTRLCQFVLDRGRRPCLWADILLQHPEALDSIPRETILFDWQYFNRPRETTSILIKKGFDVVCTPSIQSYNSVFCFLAESERNIDEHAQDAASLGALGVCISTWEHSFFTHYDATLPLIYAAAKRLRAQSPLSWPDALAAQTSPQWREAADILGNQIPAASEFLKPGTWRQLRDRFIIRQNPLYLWRDWRGEACGDIGDHILQLCDRAAELLHPLDPLQFPLAIHRVAIEWVRIAEASHRAYEQRDRVTCAAELRHGQRHLAKLVDPLLRAANRGGSRADIQRLSRMQEAIERTALRVEDLPAPAISVDKVAGYWPSFDTLFHDAYIQGDQAAWRTGSYR